MLFIYSNTCDTGSKHFWHVRKSLTLNSVGTISFGVSTPTKASTQQKIRMAKMMAKSLMSFLTWENKTNRNDFSYLELCSGSKLVASICLNCIKKTYYY